MEHAEKTVKNDMNFLSGISGIFGPNFLDETVCRQWILNRLHPSGARCPGCGDRFIGGKAKRFWHDKPLRCNQCGRNFASPARTGTALAGKNLSYAEIVFLVYHLAAGDSDIDIAAAMAINRETVRLWRRDYYGSFDSDCPF